MMADLSSEAGGSPSIMWFRADLRMHDNPALCEAAAHGPVLPVYIWNTPAVIGEAASVWVEAVCATAVSLAATENHTFRESANARGRAPIIFV